MMKPSMVPRAITDQSAAVLEPSTRLASRPVNSRVAMAHSEPHQTQRHRDAEVVVQQGKKGNGEDVIEGRLMKLLPPSVGMASSRLVNISQAMAASRGSSGVHNWCPNWPIRVMASTISNNPYRCVFGLC
jgi:hypothetical protein